MGFTTTCILFSGLCLALGRAECGDDCKAKGGKCSWKRLNPLLWKYRGACREGKWGQDQVCYCGYCYTKHKPCDQHPDCRGKCQKNPPGFDWTVTGDCYKGCKCWEEVSQNTCPQDKKCVAKGGFCSDKIDDDEEEEDEDVDDKKPSDGLSLVRIGKCYSLTSPGKS